jgi:hypothetical protein
LQAPLARGAPDRLRGKKEEQIRKNQRVSVVSKINERKH